MRRARRLVLAALIASLGQLAPSSVPRVHAAPASDGGALTKARAAFERGAALAADARWGDALAQFEESAALVPHATTTYNIGYCQRALGQATRAMKSFARALAQDAAHGGAELAADLREASKKYIEEMRGRVATPTIVVAPASATIAVDGAPLEAGDDGKVMLAGTRALGPGERLPTGVGPSFVLEVDAGTRVFELVTPDGRTKILKETFTKGDTRTVNLEVPAVAVDPEAALSARRRTLGIGLGALGVVGVGVGTWLALTARATWEDARDVCPATSTCPDDRGATLSARAMRQATGATIAFAAGGAALFGGAVLVLTASTRSTVAVHGALDPHGVSFLGLRGSF